MPSASVVVAHFDAAEAKLGMQVPFTAKQPPVISTPASVEVAVALKRVAFTPNANVDVAVVEVETM
jgi:hypothetical protein